MGRAPCCSKVGLHRGPWTPREDTLLTNYIQSQGEGNWRSLPKKAGLLRCGKSCRLRWMNYLRPDIKRGNITPDEDDLIIRLHALLGNRWSLIAGRLPGRTDNEIKNYWNTHLSKRLRRQGTDPNTHKKLSELDHRLQQQSQIKKRRNINKKNNNDKNQRLKEINSANEKPKVHLPKPVRLTSKFYMPRNNESFESLNNVSSFSVMSPSSQGDDIVQVPNWCDNNPNGLSFLGGDGGVCDDFIDKKDSDVPNSCNTSLDKIYEEYLVELLKVEEDDHDEQGQSESNLFAESMLIL